MSRWACFHCNSVYDHQISGGFCTVCMEIGTILPLPERNQKVIFESPNRNGCKAITELRGKTSFGKYIDGYEQLGKLPARWKALFYGLPGSGKTTLSLLIANNFWGKTFYASIEEAHRESFLHKLTQWEITNKNIIVSDCRTTKEIQNDLIQGSYDLVIIDSITELGDIPQLSDNYAQIWIAHATKDGHYKGNSSIAHLVDIIVKCEKGIAYFEKNRFATTDKAIHIFGECMNE